jgi:hypothetical protein
MAFFKHSAGSKPCSSALRGGLKASLKGSYGLPQDQTFSREFPMHDLGDMKI